MRQILSTKIHTWTYKGIVYHSHWCPACMRCHSVSVQGQNQSGAEWRWNGDALRPTYDPSVKDTSGHYCSTFKPGDDCWCTYNARFKDTPSFMCGVCHYYIRDGMIQYLGDSTHGLAGMTVELPDLPMDEY